MNKTKIIATIGPASSSYQVLDNMIKAGVSVCRINFSHSSYDDHLAVINNVRAINNARNTHIPILADLQGPKLRIGEVENNSILLKDGDELTITTEKCIGNNERVYITYPQFPQDVQAGETVMIDDGKISLKVLETNRINEVKTRVTHGGILSSKKGVNLPNTKVSLPCLTEKDLEDLDFALEHDVEWIGLSFVRSADDLIELKDIIKRKEKLAKIIAKIEKPEALADIDNILRETDAIMVARGDLGVEVPIEQMPLIQKGLVRKCLMASKPVIIATQMMESMITNINPLRAEVNDVANSVIDGADALMLSGETSVGNHPVMVIEQMQKIIQYIEKNEDIYNREYQPIEKTERYISDSICFTACKVAQQTGASAIVTMTHSGYTAFKISSFRPNSDVFVFTDNTSILNMLNLVWGVQGFYYDQYVSTNRTIADIKQLLKEGGFVEKGDILINIASIPIKEKGSSNMLKLSYVE